MNSGKTVATRPPTTCGCARTSFFRQTTQYSGSAVMPLGQPADDTRVLLAATRQALRKFFRPGFAYAKAGVCLLDVQPRHETQAQQQLAFDVQDSEADSRQVNKAMCVLERLSTQDGRDTDKPATRVHDEAGGWLKRQARVPPPYKPCWEDLEEGRR